MATTTADRTLAQVFSELVDGPRGRGAATVLNSGDRGLLRSLASLSAARASRSVHRGATIAAHAQHLRHGFELMNRWVRRGGDPFADASWDDAWRIRAVDARRWQAIRRGLGKEARRWLRTLARRPPASATESRWMLASVAHLAYHLGAIRQIDAAARGPREGTFRKASA